MARAAAGLTPPEAELDLLLHETRFGVDEQGRVTTTVRFAFRILSQASVERVGQVTASWRPWYQERPVIRARVITPDGSAHLLDQSTLVESAPPGSDRMLVDARQLRAVLPAVEVGAVIELEIVNREHTPFAEQGTMGGVSLDGPAWRRQLVRIETPRRLPLRHRLSGRDLAPRVTSAGDRRILEWSWTPSPSHAAGEPLAPAVGAVGAHLSFSTARSWEDVASWYAAQVDRSLAGADLSGLAQEISAGASTPELAAERIVEWMRRRIRYTALEIGAGALVPARPADVLARAYGDCKDLSTLLVGLLRALGHPADVVLTRADHVDVDPDLPGMAFDHAIVRVGGARPRYVDPTIPYLPVGVLPPSLEGSWSLAARAGSRLERLPENPLSTYRAELERELVLDGPGKAKAREVRRYHGFMAAVQRAPRVGLADDELRQRDEREARERLEAARATASFRVLPDGTVEIVSAADGSAMATAEDDAAEARLERRVLACLQAQLQPDSGDDPRSQPLIVELPCVGESHYRIRPPGGMRVAGSLPPDVEVAGDHVSYRESYRAERDGTVLATQRLEQRHGPVPAAEVMSWRRRIRTLSKDAPVVRFERTSEVLLQQGRGREALEELRRVQAESGGDLPSRLRHAAGLGRLGMVEAARRAAEEAVRIAPDSGWAWRVLASQRVRGSFGQSLASGCDLAGGIAAQRRAVELEPSAGNARGYLGYLLLHGTDCRYLGPGARLEEALEPLRHARDVLGNHRFDEYLVTALIALGRAQEAAAAARAMPPGKAREVVLLAALTSSEGVAAAGVEARAMTAERRGEALLGAVRLLERQRAFGQAAALLDAAGDGAENVATLRARAALLRRVKVLGPDQVPPGPEGVPVRVFRAIAGLAPLADVLSSERPPESAPRAEAFLRAMQQSSAELPRGPALVDLMAAALEPRFDGDPREGGLLSGGGGLRYYVVPARGRWRLLAIEGEADVLAQRSLALLKAGRPDAARRWLDWARREAPTGDEGTASPARLAEALWPDEPAPAPGEFILPAAALLAYGPMSGGAIPLLEQQLARPLPPRRREAARLALLIALSSAHEHARVVESARALLRDLPRGEPVRSFVAAQEIASLHGLGRAEEARSRLREALTVLPSAPAQLRLARVALSIGAFPEGIEILERHARGASPDPEDLNQLAWARLFVEGAPAAGLHDIELCLQQTRDRTRRAAALHTQAAILADAGEPEAAIRKLQESVAADASLVRSAAWLVVGRVAEVYGLSEDARVAYRRVESTPDPQADDSRALADRWARRLATAAGEGPKAAAGRREAAGAVQRE